MLTEHGPLFFVRYTVYTRCPCPPDGINNPGGEDEKVNAIIAVIVLVGIFLLNLWFFQPRHFNENPDLDSEGLEPNRSEKVLRRHHKDAA